MDLGFGSLARVLEHERDRTAVDVDLGDPAAVHRAMVQKGCARGPQFRALESESRPRFPRRFGEVMLRGQTRRAWLQVGFDEFVPARPRGDIWLFSNSVSFSTQQPRIASTQAQDWIRRLLHKLAPDADVLWGVVVELYPSPGDWATASGRDAHERVLAHLGRQYFYDRNAPDQETSAPDFGLPEPAPGR